jgi:sugar/nucleoside kinase (ribokinase family)
MKNFRLLGAGSPLVDYSLEVSEELLQKTVPGGKGCTRNISLPEKQKILSLSPSVLRSPGGSAANTVRIFSALGGSADLFGKLGDDGDAGYFIDRLTAAGAEGKLLVKDGRFHTGYCLSMITPDSERTMLSDLGASAELDTADLDIIDFRNFGCIILEGYMIRQVWLDEFIRRAKEAGCKIALDLNNFELVNDFHGEFLKVLAKGIDLLFANEQEAQQLCRSEKRSEIIAFLQKNVSTAVIKLGKNGAVFVDQDNIINTPALANCRVVDTTGAGDYYAAGFLFGMNCGCPPAKCAALGAICAGAIIGKTGVLLNESELQQLKYNINKEVHL